MLGVTDYGTFVAAVLIFLLIPGPGNLPCPTCMRSIAEWRACAPHRSA
jgi:hypothetical protein